MLFLLRKIRKALLTRNKFTTYLLYAIGEIFLVVIGILIAVSLNNWNEMVKNTKESTIQLTKVKEDLLLDQKRIDQVMKRNGIYINNLKLCINVLASDTILPKEEFLSNFQHMTVTSSFMPARGAFEGLISSGKIQLIGNADLLSLLITYYGDTDYISWNTAVTDFSRNVITPYLLSFDHSPNITNQKPYHFTQYDVSKFAIPGKNIADYKKDQFILNATRLKIELFEGQQIALTEKLVQIKALLDHLNREIN